MTGFEHMFTDRTKKAFYNLLINNLRNYAENAGETEESTYLNGLADEIEAGTHKDMEGLILEAIEILEV